MSRVPQLAASDRVLVIAPHPDDESIACGGLLLAARDVGAARSVVTLTDGDNNPWPQRWIEKRWRIDAAARARWGARRRAEAQAALELLGVATNERVFLGLPDTGLTALLMRDAKALRAALSERIARFRPTVIAFPALSDRHPDHSAAHIALRLAACGADSAARLLAYRVHGAGNAAAHAIELDARKRAAKRDAIARHRTQMALSGKRFLAFAAPWECFDDPIAAPRHGHPLRATLREDSRLELRLRESNLHGNREILILLGGAQGNAEAWRLPILPSGRQFEVRDARDHRPVAAAEWRSEANVKSLALPLPVSIVPRLGFAKLARASVGLVVFDRYGWQAIELA